MADVGKIVKGGLKVAKEIAEGSAARAIGKKPREVPPPFERAPAKSKEEIDVIARRIAPQITGEFVRLNPKKSVNPVGLSKRRFDIERELEHDIRPTTEIIEPENFDYAANQGRVQLGIFGDPTLSQHDIYSIAGRKLATPSRQFGGPRYAMDKPDEAWASNFGAASGLQAASKQASQQYGGVDVVGLYSKMSQDSYDFAQHVSDNLMKNIMISLPDMSKKDIDGFNRMIRNNPDAREFAGIENPDIALAQMEKNPEMRKQFYYIATTPKYTEAFNMPNGLDAVHATIIPELRNLETGITGHTVVELDPDITHLHPTTRETSTTYDTSIPRKAGTEVKKLEVPTALEMSFPDQLLEISKNPRQAGPNAFGTLKGQGARQIIDPQHIDEIGTYRDFIKKYTGKKKGGAVHMADGGKVFKAALKLLKETGEETTEAAAYKAKFEPGYWHASPSPDIERFKSPDAQFFTKDKKFANKFIPLADNWDDEHYKMPKPGSTMYPANLNLGKHFDPTTVVGQQVLKQNLHLLGDLPKDMTPAQIARDIGTSPDNWAYIENKSFIDYLKKAGYDSMAVNEDGIKNIGILNPKNIRSPFAKFDPAEAESADILKAKGGGVHMADGGKVFKAALKLLKEAGEETTEAAVKLPPAENSARTQIVGTIPTYHKARDILKGHGIEGERIIDLGAGKGLGSTIMKAHSMEPYAQGWEPTFTRAADIPSDTYEGLTNLNVLNVVSPEIRRGIIEDIGRVLKPKGGIGLITTRGKDVMNTVGGKPGPEPMSMITSRDTYQKGFTQQELQDYVKEILGDKFDYEKLDLGPAGVKVIKKAKGGAVEDDTEDIQEDPVAYLMDKIKPVKTAIDSPEEFSRRIGKPIPGVNPAIEMLRKGINPVIKALREDVEKIKPRAAIDIPVNTVSEILGAPVDIANELREPVTPIRSDIISAMKDYKLPSSEALPGSSKSFKKATTDIGLTSGEDYPALQFAAGMVGLPEVKAIGKLAKAGVKGYGNLVKEGIERNIGMFEPRMGIIKDPGGMLVGGEKALDDELIAMKRNEQTYDREPYLNALGHRMLENPQPNPNAVALNNWVNTKVRKYLRNQAGSKDDPILKAIESGVEHNFQPAMGDTKYYVAGQREKVGKPREGIAKTELGKEFEYKIDSMFDPKKSKDIKEILNSPMEFADPGTAERRRASLLRVEQDLPISNEADVEALRLINQIPDENVYTLSGTNITERLGLNHVGDVLMEDLVAGRLTPQQLDQMSIEKAVRRTAEYDAEKAKAMTKAHATSVEGMPVPKAYDDGFKWVELKHETDPKKTASALKSEGEMMGHCVGSYCPQVESGSTKIYSLRSPDNKSHVTIEVSKKSSLNSWLKANEEEINKDPLIKQMMYPNPDERYRGQYTDEELDEAYIGDITKMLKMKGAPVNEAQDTWIDIVQVKGKQNKRPDDKYQKYVSDFIKNNPTGHEITDIRELNNTNIKDVQEMIATGLTSKATHMHPDVEKAVAKLNPHLADKFAKQGWSEEIGDAKYDLFKDIAKDFATKKQYYVDEDDILNAIRAKYLKAPGKKRGGPITKKDLENQMKLDDIVDTPNLRRRYG